ncbi:1-acyl-sn-glycerol-3-phosphate acyltransferase [Planomicrobium chinense]|uniref:lysophospholipid acyltransferase family protein n=1 Tax=Planococcus chinensis TaxID=272917 RepID=UPI001CC37590|nr:lysophospholipid acyltransferase family protein [Planococcus chinensis]MBZ5202618.1 1-acyl-sn-glycerol-3-phosphate acyltransferase [Planococcus chinensis]
MYKSLRTFSFLFGYLPIAAMNLKKFRAQKENLSKQEYDALIHTEPRKWAKGIMERTRSRIETSGLEHLPDGAALLVANHEGNFDIPVLLSEIPKPFGFISKKEVKKFPVIPVYMEDMNCVFLDRTDRKSAYKSIADTVGKLKDGHSILIFPEGTRSKGEGLIDFKSGFIRIAKDAGVPIVPIAIHGTSDIMEKNNNQIRPGHVTIGVLEPITAQEIEKMNAKQLIEKVKNTIEVEVQAMAQKKTDLQ